MKLCKCRCTVALFPFFLCVQLVLGQEDSLLCLSPELNPRLQELEGPAKTVLNARKLAKVLYFFELSEQVRRRPVLDEQGKLAVVGGSQRFALPQRVFYEDENGQMVLLYQRHAPSSGLLAEASCAYEQALDEMAEAGKRAGKSFVPFDFLGVQPFPVSDVGYDTKRYDISKVRSGYEANPSRLAALAYLELALAEKKQGHLEVYADTIERAVTELDLENMDYRDDVEFRVNLHESMNFARPETCLLYLAAENARKGGDPARAKTYYSALIERGPGSPLAWEALATLTHLPGVDSAMLTRLQGVLLETYPLIWGCPRPDLKLGRDDFAKLIPTLLRAVAPKNAGEPGGESPPECP